MENGVAIAALGIVSVIIQFVVRPLIKANTEAQREQTKAQLQTARNMAELVAETRKGNREAAARNGHLGEQNEQITKLIVNHAKEAQAMVDTAATKVVEAIKSNS